MELPRVSGPGYQLHNPGRCDISRFSFVMYDQTHTSLLGGTRRWVPLDPKNPHGSVTRRVQGNGGGAGSPAYAKRSELKGGPAKGQLSCKQ